jgi:hypothetical protein
MGIPTSLLNDLKRVPRDTPTAVLMRHAPRHPISDPRNYAEAELTEAGVRVAEELGGMVRNSFSAGRLISSPVSRCQATVEAIARGAGWDTPVQIDQRLSHEFMAPAWFALERKRHRGLLPFQVQVTLRFMLPLEEEIPQSRSRPAEEPPGKKSLPPLDLLVTHDTVLGAVVGSLMDAPVLGPDWPGYLEGMLLWCTGDRIHVRWRGEAFTFSENFERIV